ncbi:hypothetical protein AMATHDRAFT_75541 [Amanita thiersii Skay4041]|uniref:sn-1-specific diacylglycerol lipase n=1 Tax=Amanita thiersii Skay4041 TaxID=703135 RepID=A0A2A9NIZ1_9AGAR|nr:hypothetical protein AMATHDRAFT_75541 [Amanita thiersii Skay4041]
MARGWDAYSRQGLDFASAATSIGFSAAKLGTRIGFCIARNVATTAVGVTTFLVDLTLFGGGTVTGPVLGGAVTTVLTLAEQFALAPIHLSEYITATSLLAAHSSINVLSVIFPGSSDASFSLASFITLVRREWLEPPPGGELPETQYGITQVARAIVAWVSLQGVTQQWQEERWFKYLHEIDVKDAPYNQGIVRTRPRRGSRVRVTSDVIFPGDIGAQIIAADIGEAFYRPQETKKVTRVTSMSKITPTATTPHQLTSSQHDTQNHFTRQDTNYSHYHDKLSKLDNKDRSIFNNFRRKPEQLSIAELKVTLRRLSKMVLAGYGGASLLFFGVVPVAIGAMPSTSSTNFTSTSERTSEEVQLTHAIEASEAEASGDIANSRIHVSSNSGGWFGNKTKTKGLDGSSYSWWDILLGKHDQEIFERSAGLQDGTLSPPGSESEREKAREKVQAEISAKMRATATIGSEHLMPRFWVLTDHNRGQVVLVLRGTMSLNEIAVDLTCEPESFEPARTPQEDSFPQFPGQYQFPTKAASVTEDGSPTNYHVHSGMLRMARAMGGVGKPVQLAVREALHQNPGFDLVLCGHSLGAGVAALLGLMWADPNTCLTVPSSGLSVGRRVYVYCFAPPCLTDADLNRLADRLIVSFVYSHDIVSRLSLGSVRDLRNAAMWLCEAEATTDDEEGWSAVTKLARKWKADGDGQQEEMDWFIAVRKTLEANMQNVNMFPPGRVLWAMRDSDLHPSHRTKPVTTAPTLETADESDNGSDKLRLFEVLDVEKVFSQIVFAKDMLSAHMPHQYDRVLHDLL